MVSKTEAFGILTLRQFIQNFLQNAGFFEQDLIKTSFPRYIISQISLVDFNTALLRLQDMEIS